MDTFIKKLICWFYVLFGVGMTYVGTYGVFGEVGIRVVTFVYLNILGVLLLLAGLVSLITGGDNND